MNELSGLSESLKSGSTSPGLVNMAIGYVLINVAPGTEFDVYQKTSSIESVIDATLLFGDYDIILKLESENLGKIAAIVVENIRQIEGVVDTKTLAGAEL